jgi:hypothetical protein
MVHLRLLPVRCGLYARIVATVGQVGNLDHENISLQGGGIHGAAISPMSAVSR